MGGEQTQSNLSESEQVSRAAELYTHINDVLDAEGQIHGFIHYHLGFTYATEQLADKLEGLGSIHFAQGKMELGRFVCLKPA